MYEDVTQVTGVETGETSVILAGVHGDELCGVRAFDLLLPNLQIERGNVSFAYGNPGAIEQNQHFVQANLNRMFQDPSALSPQDLESYEYSRSLELRRYLDPAGALLDVHASSIRNSRSFAICERNAQWIVEFLPVDLVVSGFDAVEPGGTDAYMNGIGNIGICVECGYLGDEQSTDVALQSIFAFLKARGHLPNDLPFNKQSYVRMYRKYFTATNNFTLRKKFENFDAVPQGAVIGVDGDVSVTAERDSQILFAKDGTEVGFEAFLLGEKTGTLV